MFLNCLTFAKGKMIPVVSRLGWVGCFLLMEKIQRKDGVRLLTTYGLRHWDSKALKNQTSKIKIIKLVKII